MTALFYLAGIVAVEATLLVITRAHAVHALLYLIVSLLAVAVVFFTLGAPFAAALEVIIYAGAIMVLFVFALMILNLGPEAGRREAQWLSPLTWAGPAGLTAVLLGGLGAVLLGSGPQVLFPPSVGPREVGLALFGPYVLGVELASLILLAGLVAAYHLGRRTGAPMPPSDSACRPFSGGEGSP
jgi:NADH-quinone oxidoreductase subunit J